MEKARGVLEKEVDIIKLIRSRRFVHMALKHILDPTLHKELKLLSRVQVINIEKEKLSFAKDEDESKMRNSITDMSNDSYVIPDATS